MRLRVALGAVLLLVVIGSALRAVPHTPASSHQTAPAAAGQSGLPGNVARGEYLVNSVAMCVQCHSARDLRGDLIPQERLKGGAMPVGKPSWGSAWAFRTPALAGLPGFTDEQIVMLLTEGHAGDRPRPMPPMPPFRMTKDDALAVVAYLRSR